MPTPRYISELRRVWGHTRLFLPGVAAVVVDERAGRPHVLLARRADTGHWALPAGIVEPDEHPAATMLRELYEETRIQGRIDRLALLTTDRPVTYPNGDECQFVSMVFRCSYVAGEAAVGDEESLEVEWFAADQLPELSPRDQRRIACALPAQAATVLDL